jgi:hypothetical protein
VGENFGKSHAEGRHLRQTGRLGKFFEIALPARLFHVSFIPASPEPVIYFLMNPAIFRRQLRHWTLHCLLNALPSFIIAAVWLKLRSPLAVAAMLAAIGTFILLYATLTSLNGPLSDQNHVFSRALKLGATIRAWISGLSLLLLPTEKLMIFTPDFWCGFLSVGLLTRAAELFHAGTNHFNFFNGNAADKGFLPIYATTLLEGFILSFILLMISFFAVIFLQARDRRKLWKAARP